MPERFVEVLDVASEASSILSQLLAHGQETVSNVRFNISQYINATTGHFDTRLFSALEGYNISTDDILQTMSMFNLTNSTLPAVPPPSGVGLWLIGTGTSLLAVRCAIIRWRAQKIVVEFGHAHVQ
jgi:hypothetical protein